MINVDPVEGRGHDERVHRDRRDRSLDEERVRRDRRDRSPEAACPTAVGSGPGGAGMGGIRGIGGIGGIRGIEHRGPF